MPERAARCRQSSGRHSNTRAKSSARRCGRSRGGGNLLRKIEKAAGAALAWLAHQKRKPTTESIGCLSENLGRKARSVPWDRAQSGLGSIECKSGERGGTPQSAAFIRIDFRNTLRAFRATNSRLRHHDQNTFGRSQFTERGLPCRQAVELPLPVTAYAGATQPLHRRQCRSRQECRAAERCRVRTAKSSTYSPQHSVQNDHICPPH